MGINDKLLELLDDIGQNEIGNYGLNLDKVREFMHLKTNKTDFIEKQRKAIEIIESIMKERQKSNPICLYLKELAKIEHNAREIVPHLRDHVVHALLSFILGIYINEKFLRQRKVPEFQWVIAGLLHDIGYPLEVASNIMGSFTKKINCLKYKTDIPEPDINPDINIEINPVGLDKLTNDNSLCLIQKRLNEWELSSINARNEYEEMIKSGKICHGIMGSLAILYIIDLLYQNNPSWERPDFYDHIVSACSAVFIHNLPNKCFTNECFTKKISPTRAPLAFLLKLSDCLQDWERPSKENSKGFPDDQYDIDISNDRIKFTVENENQRSKIFKEISETLYICPKINEQCSEIVLAFRDPQSIYSES